MKAIFFDSKINCNFVDDDGFVDYRWYIYSIELDTNESNSNKEINYDWNMIIRYEIDKGFFGDDTDYSNNLLSNNIIKSNGRKIVLLEKKIPIDFFIRTNPYIHDDVIRFMSRIDKKAVKKFISDYKKKYHLL